MSVGVMDDQTRRQPDKQQDPKQGKTDKLVALLVALLLSTRLPTAPMVEQQAVPKAERPAVPIASQQAMWRQWPSQQWTRPDSTHEQPANQLTNEQLRAQQASPFRYIREMTRPELVSLAQREGMDLNEFLQVWRLNEPQQQRAEVEPQRGQVQSQQRVDRNPVPRQEAESSQQQNAAMSKKGVLKSALLIAGASLFFGVPGAFIAGIYVMNKRNRMQEQESQQQSPEIIQQMMKGRRENRTPPPNFARALQRAADHRELAYSGAGNRSQQNGRAM